MFIDTLISASLVSLVMLAGVLASAIYEKLAERRTRMEKVIVKAPCFSYESYCLAECVGISADAWGTPMIKVRALHGTPWTDAGFFGYTPTNRAKFYPEHLTKVETVAFAEATVSEK